MTIKGKMQGGKCHFAAYYGHHYTGLFILHFCVVNNLEVWCAL